MLTTVTSSARASRRLSGAPARVALCAALLASAPLLPSCRTSSTEPKSKAATPKELTPDELRELLEQGTIRPVTQLEGDNPFAELEGGMDEPRVPAVVPPPVGSPKPAPVAAPEPPQNPFLQFGARIKVYPDGTITKPFPLRVGTGEKLKSLLETYGNFPLWTPDKGQPSPPSMVKLDLLAGWDVELYQDLRDVKTAAAGTPAALADWLVVTAGPELMQEVEDFLNLFAAGVPQIEIEAKIVEVTLNDILDVGVRSPDGTPMFQFPSTAFVKSFDSSMQNIANNVEGVLTVGGVQDAVTFNAALEALAVNDNVSIISRPKIAVREGGRADISNTSKIPYLNITGVNNAGGFANATIAYQEVGVKLFVVPRVVGTQTVALNIDVEQSQISGSETVLVTSSDSPVQVPVVSQRGARTVVYLQPGQAVILGGLITERTVDNERKVPFLGDIPLLGLLFKAKFTRKEQTNVLFFIRPRILQGNDLNREF